MSEENKTVELKDVRLLLTAVDRMQDFDGNMKDTFSQEEVEKMFGVDTNDFERIEIE